MDLKDWVRRPATDLRNRMWRVLGPLARSFNGSLLGAYDRRRRPLWLKMARLGNGMQLSGIELAAVVDALRARGPAPRLLVFGLGRDSPFWLQANRGGHTLFLEDQQGWIDWMRRAVPNLPVTRVEYGTRLENWRNDLERQPFVPMQLPAEALERPWDVILVDAPAGWRGSDPGRLQSIEAAVRLAGRGAAIFVHDAERPAERAAVRHFLGKGQPVPMIGRLACARSGGVEPDPQAALEQLLPVA